MCTSNPVQRTGLLLVDKNKAIVVGPWVDVVDVHYGLLDQNNDRSGLNLSRKHQPKPNLNTEVRRNGMEVLKKCTDEYQTLVQGLIKGCRE
jgi:hypothetical protein